MMNITYLYYKKGSYRGIVANARKIRAFDIKKEENYYPGLQDSMCYNIMHIQRGEIYCIFLNHQFSNIFFQKLTILVNLCVISQKCSLI